MKRGASLALRSVSKKNGEDREQLGPQSRAAARSKADADHYQLYRVLGFRDRPGLFSVPGAIEATSALEATTYLARPGG